jgi:hypothetical protein
MTKRSAENPSSSVFYKPGGVRVSRLRGSMAH